MIHAKKFIGANDGKVFLSHKKSSHYYNAL